MLKNEILYEIQIDAVGKFIERVNRFTAKIELENGEIIIAHIHDSGRIKELLFEGNTIVLRKAKNTENRKTAWDVIAALADDGEEILINSSFHRYVAENILKNPYLSPFGEYDFFKAEVKYGKSRLDFLISNNNSDIYIETKGVSLSIDKVATFPDAPSVRATKHLNELIEIKESEHRAAVILLIFRDSNSFSPNFETDPLFSKTFYKAIDKGVEIYPIQLMLENGKIFFVHKKIEIKQL